MKREARSERILDAASALILRYGYQKTTIDDIARLAGVGKGTLYLHWKTREDLFTALVLREKLAMTANLGQLLAQDPAGATLRGLLKYSALALMQRPLLKAVIIRDREVLGNLIEREQSNDTSIEIMAGFTAYLETLRAQSLVRSDIPLPTLVTLFASIFLGFFLAAPLLPAAFKPPDEELAELIAETGHRTLEPDASLSPAALQVASHTLTHYLDHAAAKAQKRLLKENPVESFDYKKPPTSTSTRARGRKGGRSKKLSTEAEVAMARRMYADKTRSIEEICAELGISRATFYRAIRDEEPEES